jgi:GGDEF domain-containing protein
VPGGPVVLAALALVYFAGDSPTVARVATGYPYAVFGAAALLAWRFHRSRVVAALVAVAIGERLLGASAGADATFTADAAAVVLPPALGLLALGRDRGVLTVRGLAQVVGVVALSIGAGFLVYVSGAIAAGLPGDARPGTVIADPVFLAGAAGLALATFAALCRRGAVEQGFVWALVAVLVAMQSPPGSPAATVYLTAAGLVLGLSVLETSYRMAYRDGLTGLPGRRALLDALADLRGRYTIAMLDVDRFKKLNDRHGHDVGDQVLKLVASRLARAPGGGRAFRYGGEEFTLLFPGRTREETIPHLERLRREIAAYTFTVRGRRRRKSAAGAKRPRRAGRKKLTVTVSIGVAERDGAAPAPEAVLKAADRALYRAKRAGRNRVSG